MFNREVARAALCQLFLLLLSYLSVFWQGLLEITPNKVIKGTIKRHLEQKVINIYRKNRPVPPWQTEPKWARSPPKNIFPIFFLTPNVNDFNTYFRMKDIGHRNE